MDLDSRLLKHDRFVGFNLKKEQLAHVMYKPLEEHGYGVILAQHYNEQELNDFLQRYNNEGAFANLVYTQRQSEVLPFHVVDGQPIHNLYLRNVFYTAVPGRELLVPVTLDILLNRDKHNEYIRASADPETLMRMSKDIGTTYK